MIFRTNFFAELKLFEDLSNSSPINVTVAFTSTHTAPSCSNLIRFKFHAMSQSSHNGKRTATCAAGPVFDRSYCQLLPSPGYRSLRWSNLKLTSRQQASSPSGSGDERCHKVSDMHIWSSALILSDFGATG